MEMEGPSFNSAPVTLWRVVSASVEARAIWRAGPGSSGYPMVHSEPRLARDVHEIVIGVC